MDEFGTPFAFVISSIFANRLLISIRSAYFKDEDNTILFPSIHFAKVKPGQAAQQEASIAGTGTHGTTIEMTTFNERIGV